ncbi:hypothetical protein SAMN02745164_01255 [Marinitoga hydrogenitolerans DSM 16785]|uniref:Uncharacterized protein n=2 Tax=Marinitoga TaxID=160798 RepID=A0A1M4WTI8_MARH1|nr:hypothetical protein SAMN02745164_01255 [Marinitoga hydrogenitolerans DSM 16785]
MIMNKKILFKVIKSISPLILLTVIIKKFSDYPVSTKDLIGYILIFSSILFAMFNLQENYNINNKIITKQLIILFVINNFFFLWGALPVVMAMNIVSIFIYFEKLPGMKKD